jgi:hypothetical protein
LRIRQVLPWGDEETEGGITTLERGHAALALLLLVVLLALIDEVLAAREHEIHHSRELPY